MATSKETDMKAVILAAGRGTRMRHLTDDRPKPMIDIGKQRILEKIIDSIHRAGIGRFVVVTGYHANLIEDHFGDGRAFGIQITYVRQPVLDGTGGALRVAQEAAGGEPFLLTFGDIITTPSNYPAILDHYRHTAYDALLGVNAMDDPCQGAAVYIDEKSQRVRKIIEKPPKGTSTTPWNNSGLFVFSPCVFEYVHRIPLSPRGEYELTDAIRLMIEDGRAVGALPLKGFWGDLATPEDVEQLRRLIEEDENILTNIS